MNYLKFTYALCLLVFMLPSSELVGQESNDNKENICRVYGKVQGMAYDRMVKICSATGSSESCKDLLEELKNSFNMAVSSKEEYIETNVMACNLTMNVLEDGIYFTIEGGFLMKEKLESLYDVLVSSEDVEVEKDGI